MGNNLSATAGNQQQPHGGKAGLPKFLRRRIKQCHTPSEDTLPAEAPAEPQDDCPAIQTLLEALNLSIYCDAFGLAGWASSSVCHLAALTEADLAQIQALSKVPILPNHQSLILAACRQLGASLGSPPDAPAGTEEKAAAAATSPAAAVQSPTPDQDTAPNAAAHGDQTSPAPNPAARGSASSQQGKTATVQQQQQQQQQQQHSQGRRQSPCPLMDPFLCDWTDSNTTSPAVLSPAAAADGTRPAAAAAAAQASPASGASPEAETEGTLCPSSNLSSRSQRAADAAAAAAASSLNQAAMHLERATLSERSMRQQRHVQQHSSAPQPQETPRSGGSPSLSACMPQTLFAPAADTAAVAAAAVGQGLPADAAAPTAERGCFFHNPDHSSELEWDDANPFSVDVLPATTWAQHNSLMAQQGAEGDGCAVSEGPTDFACADQGEDAAAVPFAEAAATAVAAGHAAVRSRAAAAVTAGAGATAFGGPLTSNRSHLPRPSSSRGLGSDGRNLCSPEAAAAAARLPVRGCAWNNLPGEVASLSFAATASLHTKPLPALAAVASGQPQKQKRAVAAEPGALTVHAGQLPLRPVSESGLSMWHGPAAGRHPGLRAEESAAGAAVALQQLSRQQADTQDLIQRLLYAPPAAAASAHTGGGCPSVALGPEPWTAGPCYSQQQGYNLAAQQGSSALLLPEGSALSSVLDHSTARLLLVQQPPQVLVLAPQGAPVSALQFPELLSQHHVAQQHQQQQWQTLQQDRSSASIAGSAVGPGLTGYSGAHSCIQLSGGARSHAADVNDIVLRTKARATAKQQQQQLLLLQRQHHHHQHYGGSAGGHQHQHHQQQQHQQHCRPDVTPTTPVLGSDRLAAGDLAAGGLKGAAAMLACNLRPDASSVRLAAGASLAAAAPPPRAGTGHMPGSPLSGTAGTAAGSSSLAAAAVRDGDRVLQMLQECKELAELDKAVKSRMMQLLHSATASQSRTAAAGAQAAAVPSAARCAAPEEGGWQGQPVQTAGGSSGSGRSPAHVLSEVRSQQHQQQQQGFAAHAAAQPRPAVGTNSCAGVLHAASNTCGPQAAEAAMLRPETSGSVAGISTADAPAQSSSKAADQAPTPQQARVPNKDSPGGKGLLQRTAQHSDQQKSSGCLHSSPGHQTASTKAARQLWRASRVPVGVASAAGSDSVAAHPAAQMLGAAGMPGRQPVKGSSVAALVAAVAGRPSKGLGRQEL